MRRRVRRRAAARELRGAAREGGCRCRRPRGRCVVTWVTFLALVGAFCRTEQPSAKGWKSMPAVGKVWQALANGRQRMVPIGKGSAMNGSCRQESVRCGSHRKRTAGVSGGLTKCDSCRHELAWQGTAAVGKSSAKGRQSIKPVGKG